MHREYHRWHSPSLGRDMELLVIGHGGMPFVVFPTSLGRFFEYEDRGMIDAVWWQFEHGRMQAFCVDSVDAESWYNRGVHPGARAARHQQYDAYVMNEVMPLLRGKNWSPRIGATGCSFGGYHAVNFGLRHPEIFTDVVSMGGAYDIHQFVYGHWDENCYFNCPPDYIRNMPEGALLDTLRSGRRYVLATGEHDICLNENLRLAGILQAQSIPCWLDVWGGGTGHDWPWWQQMARKYFG